MMWQTVMLKKEKDEICMMALFDVCCQTYYGDGIKQKTFPKQQIICRKTWSLYLSPYEFS